LNKLVALLLAVLFILLLSNQITIFNVLSEKNQERVTIIKVTDGDTFKLSDGRNLRLVNINAPEKSVPASSKSIDFVRQLENTTVSIEVVGTDKYGRTLARVYAPEYLNLELVSLGLASKFLVQKGEEILFDKEEQQAIEEQKGIWQHSEYWGCFSINIDERKEIFYLDNICDISLVGFSLKDESRKIYKFQEITNSRLALHTFNGSDNKTDLFWNSKESVWNDDRDSAYLFDSEGRIAGYYSYGYR
jgi:micrococcal nuclease